MTELRDPAEVFAAEIGWQPALERTDLLADPAQTWPTGLR